MKAPELYRVKNHPLLPPAPGNNGYFKIPHYKIDEYYFACIVSDGMGWEHVSVSLHSKKRNVERCPTWEEMCWIKDQFWNEYECVIQFHPTKDAYVNMHPYCLHLWKPIGVSFPVPLPEMVGINLQTK